MRVLAMIAALAAVATPMIAHAQAAETAPAATAKAGAFLRSSDGKRIGRINSIETASNGTAFARLIYDARVVRVPVSTISSADKGLVTSLSMADIRKGN